MDTDATRRWFEAHRHWCMSLLRIYLGVGLVVKSIQFAAGREELVQLMNANDVLWAGMGLAHVIILTHFFGGALMAWINLGISPSMFRTRLIEGTDMTHVFVGLVKAPVFALIIGVVGCHAGMQVKGDAESLGRKTSNAVVTAIFSVIVADALFSIFFAQIGI